MSTSIAPRSAGIGLLVYALATFVAFMLSGAPGGDYSDTKVVGYIAAAHAPVAFIVWYIAALGALALVVFGAGLRKIPGVGQPLSALATIGAALSVAGSLLAGGVAVGMSEGGSVVREQTPHAVVYLVTEIGNLAAVCGPALCVGVIAIVIAMRTRMPVWLQVVAVIGGVCGILAPFYLTYLLYLLAVLALGVALLTGRAVRERMPERASSIV
ncbi:hypothetical protein GCM10022240_25220 [Microbacterium kribbense]|uniref:DUF4386 family protein n=1 Tax=Microbacterium kribbense TaxID=433645 RepID=A0ABP7GQ97_9MICO